MFGDVRVTYKRISRNSGLNSPNLLYINEMTENTQKPVILVGGGTGGHIMPLIAIAEEMNARKIPFIYVGGKESREEKMVKDLGWQFVGIDAGKWRRETGLKSIWLNMGDGFKVIAGFFQSVKILRQSKAEVVFSKGGFVALPMVYAAKFLKVRLIIHESDVYMGLTNKLSARFADKVLTAFDPKVFSNSDERYIQVGIPIRKSLRAAADLKAPAKNRPVLLVMGGIQGAMAINNYIKQTLPELVKKYDVVHSVGEQNFALFKTARESLKKTDQAHYKPYSFIDRELSYYYQTADLIISRASATVIAEGALFGKTMYLIPLPTSAGNHQVLNAKYLAEANAVEYREQYQLSGEKVLADVNELISNPDKMKQLGSNLRNYFNENKTIETIMEIILNGKS